MKTTYISFIGTAVKTLKAIGIIILIFCTIGTIIKLSYFLEGASDFFVLYPCLEPFIIGLFGFAICFGLSSIIKHLVLIKEQQNLLLEEKGIIVEFKEVPEGKSIQEETPEEESKE